MSTWGLTQITQVCEYAMKVAVTSLTRIAYLRGSLRKLV
jgi:hypothetical protein